MSGPFNHIGYKIVVAVIAIGSFAWIARSGTVQVNGAAQAAQAAQSAQATQMQLLQAEQTAQMQFLQAEQTAQAAKVIAAQNLTSPPRSVGPSALSSGRTDDPAGRMAWAEVLQNDVDPRVVTDAAMLERIKAAGLPWRIRDRLTGIEMLLVPAGRFVMGMSVGDEAANSDEKPAHEVILTKPFYLGRTEVTQEQWKQQMGWNESYFQDINFQQLPAGDHEAKITEWMENGFTRQQAEEKVGPEITTPVVTATWPVETLTWEAVQEFLVKTHLRLPTEAEWEFAARAGSTQPLYGTLDLIAWNSANSGERTHPVGSKLPNALGFYDMLGNVWEWTNDWYAADYYRSCEIGATDPLGPGQNPFRVLRGGSWDHDASNCRVSFRLNHFTGDPRITDFGFRVARTP